MEGSLPDEDTRLSELARRLRECAAEMESEGSSGER